MNSAEASARSTPLAPKLVSEVRELHDRNVALARDAGGPRGRRGRRERKEARDAENDLLRVLGFASFEAFVAYVDGPVVAPAAEVANGANLAIVEMPSSASALDAEQTEAALLRVLHGDGQGSRSAFSTQDDDEDDDEDDDDEFRLGRGARPVPGGLADLHARIAVFEEELAEARFELTRMRDLRRSGALPDDSEATGAVPAAADALVQAAAELRSLCELLRQERADLAALGATARVQAEQVLEAARLDAQVVRDEAAVAARAVLDQASADAVALTRNAISTVDGLRRLAGEERGPAPGES